MEKRWIGGVLVLALLLILGLWISDGMERFHAPVAYELEQAAQAALQGGMTDGETWMHQAENRWLQGRWLTAAVADHSPMEEIDSIFAQLKSYGAADDRAAFAAWCSRAASLIKALGESNHLTWQNLL
jgi:hypothetical protein